MSIKTIAEELQVLGHTDLVKAVVDIDGYGREFKNVLQTWIARVNSFNEDLKTLLKAYEDEKKDRVEVTDRISSDLHGISDNFHQSLKQWIPKD